MSKEQEYITFQEIIHHISSASDACGRFGHMREDNRWLLIANKLIETRELIYRLSEDLALEQTRQ